MTLVITSTVINDNLSVTSTGAFVELNVASNTAPITLSIAEGGATGVQGEQGENYAESFESVSKNIASWNYTLNYTGVDLTSIVYTDGSDAITKTFNRTGEVLTSIVLSGDTPAGISLTKTLNYTSTVLTSITYS